MTKIERQIINNQIALINYIQNAFFTSTDSQQVNLMNVKRESEELLKQDDEYRRANKKITDLYSSSKKLHDQFTKGKRLLDEYHKAVKEDTEGKHSKE